MTEKTVKKDLHTSVAENNKWFDELVEAVVHNIRVDQLAINTNTASPEKVKYYDALKMGSEDDIYGNSREMTNKYYIKKMLIEYLTEILDNVDLAYPKKLAMKPTNSKILVWAEVGDDDEKAENIVILSEAKINAKYFKSGFHISTTIVEENDNIEIPPHYTQVIPDIETKK